MLIGASCKLPKPLLSGIITINIIITTISLFNSALMTKGSCEIHPWMSTYRWRHRSRTCSMRRWGSRCPGEDTPSRGSCASDRTQTRRSPTAPSGSSSAQQNITSKYIHRDCISAKMSSKILEFWLNQSGYYSNLYPDHPQNTTDYCSN